MLKRLPISGSLHVSNLTVSDIHAQCYLKKANFVARARWARKSKPPTRPTDTTGTDTQKASSQFDAKIPKGLSQNLSYPFFKALDLSSDRAFLVQKRDLVTNLGTDWSFSSQKCEFGAHLLLSNRAFFTQKMRVGVRLLLSNRPFLTQKCDFGAHICL